MENKEEVKQVHCASREEWRAWLMKNHEKEKKVALISHKKHTGKPSMSHHEAMEEAICFGWIDTIAKRLDEDRYIRHFARRTDKSKWSSNTIKYGRNLIKRKLMTPAGLKRFKEGLKKPLIDLGLGKNPKIPNDMKKILEKESLMEKFNKVSPSYRGYLIRQMLRAKRPETKEKRMKEIIDFLKHRKQE